MIKKLEEALMQKGFIRAAVPAADMKVVFKLTPNGLCYLCILDDTENRVEKRQSFSREQLAALGRALLEKCTGYAQSCYGLTVIVTDQPELSRQKLEEDTPFWIVNTFTRKLMIYDDQPGNFLDARNAIEGCLSSTPVKEILFQLKALYSPVNVTLIGLNVLYFIILEILGSTEDAWFMYQHGALYSQTFFSKQEYWTLLTSAFMHFGFLHLFYNMVTLLYVGRPVEVMMGWKRYLTTYLVSGIASGFISILWYIYVDKTVAVCAGASGAICGVCGALLYILLRNRKLLKQISWIRYLVFFAIVVTNGMSDSSVNSCAHISGMVVGFLMAALLYCAPKTNEILYRLFHPAYRS